MSITSHILAASGTSIYKVNPTTDKTHRLQRSVGAGRQVDMLQFNNRALIAVNGSAVKKYDGVSVVPAGIAAPPYAPAVAGAVVAPPNLTGLYSWRFTFYNSNLGIESDPSPAASLTLAGEKGVIKFTATSWPGTLFLTDDPSSANPQVTHVRLYRTVANGDALLYVQAYPVQDVIGNVSVVDVLQDASLGSEVEYTHGVPPASDFMAVYADRVWYKSTAHTSRIYFSEAGEGEYVQDSSFIEVNPDDGDKITGLVAFQRALFVFKEDAIYTITGDSSDNFQSEQYSNNVGCVSHFSIAPIGTNEAIFLHETGFYRLSGEGLSSISDGLLPDIAGDVGGIDFVQAETRMRAIYWPRKKWYCIALPVISSYPTIRDQVWIYDTFTGGWKTRAIRADAMGLVDDANNIAEWWAGMTIFDSAGDTKLQVGTFWKMGDSSYNQGAPSSGTVGGLATAGGANTLTMSSASFLTSGIGLTGAPVSIISGTGVGQVRYIRTNTATVLTVDENWTTIPDTTSQFLIGTLNARYQTGWLDLGTSLKKRVLYLDLVLDRQPGPYDLDLVYYLDLSTTGTTVSKTAIAWNALWTRFAIHKKARVIRFELLQRRNNQPFGVKEMKVEYQVKEGVTA